jgi:NitT/TauT family transport system ATP-binding protein
MDISVVQLSKSFGEKVVLHRLNATFIGGRINCLIGASGSGKTTLLQILMGLIKPEEGEIFGCEGIRVAAVFQEDRLIEHWSAVKNIKLVCDKVITEERIRHELDQVGIAMDKDIPVSKFSGGMRRRVAIVRAVLAESELLIMDEPFKGLDEALKYQMMEYVKQNTEGKTVIIVTHDSEELKFLNANVISL